MSEKLTTEVLVVGAGIAGTTVALALARSGANVVVAERGAVCSGSSGLNAGGLRQQFTQATSIEAGKDTIRQMKTFQDDYGIDPSFRQAGYLFLHNGGRHLATLERAVATQNRHGVDTRLIGLEELRELVPGINTDDLEGAAYGPTDGYMDPNSMVAGYAAGARRAGVKILQEHPVESIETSGGRVTGVRAGGVSIACDVLVNAAGAWSPALAALYGATLPIKARRNQIFVLDQTPAPGRLIPLTIDLVTGLYFHSEGSGIVSGYAEAPEIPDAPPSIACDWDDLPMLVERLIHRVPKLESAGVTHGWAGLIETTPDDNPIVGWTHLGNVYTVAGFSGHGMCLAPGLAPHIAAEIRGATPGLDLDIYRLERLDAGGVEPEGVWGGEGISRGTAEVPA
ncbi:MAG TPA: FAD-binding oxidoreductase [Candidatus Dormibacteraeota bacterium]|nr:FAD-binding oxidoreductase [Candidatus Dormibacteraeota bacterium]